MVVIILLVIGIFCLFVFVPVQFQIKYNKLDWNDLLVLEISFLYGLLKHKKEISLLKLNPEVKKKEKVSSRWFFFRKSKVKKVESSKQINFHSWQEFLDRYQHFGMGMTLLKYFIPAKYERWLLVVEDLEKQGCFTKFKWITRLGTGEPAGTAVLYSLLWGFKASLLNMMTNEVNFCPKPEIKVIADFQSPRLDTNFDCIFRVKLGYIIIAAFIARFRHRLLKGGIGVGDPSN